MVSLIIENNLFGRLLPWGDSASFDFLLLTARRFFSFAASARLLPRECWWSQIVLAYLYVVSYVLDNTFDQLLWVI